MTLMGDELYTVIKSKNIKSDTSGHYLLWVLFSHAPFQLEVLLLAVQLTIQDTES
jgi:hypothetical protein